MMLNQEWIPLRKMLFYIGGLVLVVIAGFLDIWVLERLDEMSFHLRLALKLRAIAIVESMESQVLLQQAEFEERQAGTFQAKAQLYFNQVHFDQDKAQTYMKEAQYYEQLADEDQAQANAIGDKIHRDETLRVELLKNISLDQRHEEDLMEGIQHINKGLCDTRIAGWMCDVVGGAVELQRQADQEAIQIQQETAFLEQVTRREFMEKLVAASLQGNATEYKKISSDLLQTAQYWDSLAQKDYTNAIELNETATELEDISEKSFHNGERERQFTGSNLIHSEKEVELAVGFYKNAVRLATAATTFAVFALGFFAPGVVSQFISHAKSAHQFLCGGDVRSTTPLEFWRRMCAILLHIGIFFLSTGLCRNFVSLIEHYDLRERTAIIAWFAFVAGLSQTVFTQTIPHILAEWPLRRQDVLHVTKHSLLRLLFLMPLYGLELLIAYNTFPSLVSPNVSTFFGNPAIVWTGIAMACLYVHAFEPRDSAENIFTNMHPALAGDHEASSSCSASEATPLTAGGDDDYSHHNSLAGTESTAAALMAMDLGRRGREVSTASSSSSSDYISLESMSPYFVRLDVQLSLLRLVFEVLIVVALVGILMDTLPLLYHYNPARVVVPLSLSLVTLLAVVAGLCWMSARRKRRRLSPKADDDRHIEIVSL